MLDWKAAVSAGLVAGVVFVILEMLMVWLFAGKSPWGPPRMIGAIVLGEDVLPAAGAAGFAFGTVGVAVILHLALSVVYGFVGGLAVHRMPTGPAVVVGGVLGLVLYLINFYGFTGVFPWFAEARNWITITTHIIFGLAAAWTYKSIQSRAPVRATSSS